MKNNWQNISLFLIGVLFAFCILKVDECNRIVNQDKYDAKSDKDTIAPHKDSCFICTKESFKKLLVQSGIQHPDVVLQQAICETGWFKSEVFIKYNNCFGFHNGKHYVVFKNVNDCISYYKNYQMKYYDGNKDYYMWLDTIGYAKDSCYTDVLKGIKI